METVHVHKLCHHFQLEWIRELHLFVIDRHEPIRLIVVPRRLGQRCVGGRLKVSSIVVVPHAEVARLARDVGLEELGADVVERRRSVETLDLLVLLL